MEAAYLHSIKVVYGSDDSSFNGFKLYIPGYRPYYHVGWINKASIDDMEFIQDVINVMEADCKGYEKSSLLPLLNQLNVHQYGLYVDDKLYKYEEYGYLLKGIK